MMRWRRVYGVAPLVAVRFRPASGAVRKVQGEAGESAVPGVDLGQSRLERLHDARSTAVLHEEGRLQVGGLAVVLHQLPQLLLGVDVVTCAYLKEPPQVGRRLCHRPLTPTRTVSGPTASVAAVDLRPPRADVGGTMWSQAGLPHGWGTAAACLAAAHRRRQWRSWWARQQNTKALIRRRTRGLGRKSLKGRRHSSQTPEKG